MDDHSQSHRPYQAAYQMESWFALVTWQFSSFLCRANLVSLIMGVLVARTSIMADLYPFGIAFAAAIAVMVPRRTLMASAGVVIGILTVETRVVAIEHTLMLVGLAAALALFRGDEADSILTGARSRRALLRTAIIVFVTFVLVHGPYVYVFAGDAVGLSPYKLLTLVIGAAAASLSALVFASAVTVVQTGEQTEATPESLAPIFLLAVAVSGLRDVMVGPIHIQTVVGGLIIISLAWLGGPGTGSVSGILIGSITSPAGLFYPPLMGRLALAGLTAGWFARLGRVGSVLGFAVANLALTYYLLQPDAVVATLWETAVAGIGFLLLPPKLVEQLISVWDEESARHANDPKRHRSSLDRGIDSLRAWFAPAESYRPQNSDTDSEQVPEIAARLHQFSTVFDELSRSFHEPAPAEDVAQANHEEVVEILAQRVCAGCESFRRCWDERFYQSYRGVLDLFTNLELGEKVERADVLEKVPRCARPDVMAVEVNQLFEYRLIEQRWIRRVNETRGIVATQLRGASEVMEKLALEVEQEASQKPALRVVRSRPRYTHVMGVSRRAKEEGSVSGDSYLVRELPDGRWAFIVSDGMGAGARASLESTTTTELLYRLLEAGFTAEVAVRTINSVLLFRSPDDVFATVDLVLFDTSNGACEFIKVGAAPSFIRRGRKVTRIDANTLPVGILNDIDIEVRHRVLKTGDLLVMLTDGVLNARGQGVRDQWVAQHLRSIPMDLEPQEAAQELVQLAADAVRPPHVDDLTALVFRIT